MATFNTAPVSVGTALRSRADATVNHEGGLAFTMDPRTRLFTRVLATFCGEPKYYVPDGASELAAIREDVQLVAATDPEFVLRLAAYARQEMRLRSVPIVLLTEAAAIPSCKPFVRTWTPHIVRRADEPAEVVAAWIATHGHIGARGERGGTHAFPHSLRKGLAGALEAFDEYQVAKYDRPKAVTMRDVLRIVRPTPSSPSRAALYQYLVRGELDAAQLPKLAAKAALLRKEAFDAEARDLATQAHATWEVLTSKFGRGAEVWNALQLPFMAGIRNLANLMRNGADEALDRVIAQFRDAETVRRSKQLPFRFFSAYRLIESGQRFDHRLGYSVPDERVANHPRRTAVLEAILTALESSVANLPHLDGRTFITADNSGSMDGTLSEKTTVRRKDVANLLAAIAHTMCDDAICSVFGESHAVVPALSRDSIMTNMARLANTDVGYSTNAWKAIRHLRDRKIVVDRILVLSDEQCYSTHGWGGESLAEELVRYRREVAPEVRLYSVDLAGYGTAQFPSDDRRVATLAGWSERLLAFIPAFEADGTQAVDRISTWTPQGIHPDEPDADAASE